MKLFEVLVCKRQYRILALSSGHQVCHLTRLATATRVARVSVDARELEELMCWFESLAICDVNALRVYSNWRCIWGICTWIAARFGSIYLPSLLSSSPHVLIEELLWWQQLPGPSSAIIQRGEPSEMPKPERVEEGNSRGSRHKLKYTKCILGQILSSATCLLSILCVINECVVKL